MNKTQPVFTRPFPKPWIPPKHPRADEIDRDQPPFSSGIRLNGNGDENSKVWRR